MKELYFHPVQGINFNALYGIQFAELGLLYFVSFGMLYEVFSQTTNLNAKIKKLKVQ
jgi:hypothetical protein